MNQDYYKILGVNKSATPNEIKKAYRKLAFEWHPDRHQKDKTFAEKRFKQINQAYQVLSDPVKKNVYDGAADQKQRPNTGNNSNNRTSYSSSRRGTSNSTIKKRGYGFLFWVILAVIASSALSGNQSKTESFARSSIPVPTDPSLIQNGAGFNIELNSPTPSATLYQFNPPTAEPTPTVDCVGPDGKHMQVSKQTCDDFNKAWQPTPRPTASQNNDVFNFSTGCGTCGQNSSCSFGSCSCNDGYTKNYSTGNCDPCPPNSTGQFGSCTCNHGYTKNYSTGLCDVLTCPANSSESFGSCICNNGYTKNYSTGNCDPCPPNSTGQFGSCTCNSGYHLNYTTGLCDVLTCPPNSTISSNSCICNSGYYMDFTTNNCVKSQ